MDSEEHSPIAIVSKSNRLMAGVGGTEVANLRRVEGQMNVDDSSWLIPLRGDVIQTSAIIPAPIDQKQNYWCDHRTRQCVYILLSRTAIRTQYCDLESNPFPLRPRLGVLRRPGILTDPDTIILTRWPAQTSMDRLPLRPHRYADC